jgi:spermidine/putrescine transport system permease protein
VLLLVWGWLLTLVLAPNLLVLGASLLTRDPLRFLSLPISADSYLRLFDPLYLAVFLHSLAMAVATTVICLLLGYPFAWALGHIGQRRRPLLIFLLILPFWTNSLVRTYAIKLLLAANGLVNGALLGLGLIAAPVSLLYTEGAVIFGLVYLLLPFMILPLHAVFEDLRPELLLVSRDLGAGRIATFVHVILPLTLPGAIAGVLLVLLPALGMFYVADVLGGAKNLLVGNVIKDQFLDARDWPFGAAASVLLTGAMALLLAVQHWSRRRLGRALAQNDVLPGAVP